MKEVDKSIHKEFTHLGGMSIKKKIRRVQIFKNTFKKITKKDIIKLETTLGYKLPENYCEFLLMNNGGVVEPYVKVKVNDVSSYVNLDAFHGIETGNSNSDILSWTTK